jgi:hypothetical protein
VSHMGMGMGIVQQSDAISECTCVFVCDLGVKLLKCWLHCL